MTSRIFSLMIATLFVALNTPSAVASSAYTCTVFNYGNESSATVPLSINNKGEVVGYSYVSGTVQQHAFLRSPDGTVHALTLPGVADNFTPAAINNLSQVLGIVSTPNSDGTFGSAFLLNADGTDQPINPPVAPSGHTYSSFTYGGLNDNGEISVSVVGDLQHGIGTIWFFIRSKDGTYRQIDQIGTGTTYAGEAGPINNSGIMLQNLRGSDGALLYPDGTTKPLTFLGFPYDSFSSAGATSTVALNNNNETAGNVNGYSVAFLRTPDGHFPGVVCPEVPDARLRIAGVNDYGVVIGNNGSGIGLGTAFIATPTGVFPSLELSNSSWTFGIHPVGETVGLGRIYVNSKGPADLHITSVFVGKTGQSTDQPRLFRS
jgi:hypothetical protein